MRRYSRSVGNPPHTLALAGCSRAYGTQCTSLEDPEWNITALDRGPTGTAHAADPYHSAAKRSFSQHSVRIRNTVPRPNGCRPMAGRDKNRFKFALHGSNHHSKLRSQSPLCPKAFPRLCSRYVVICLFCFSILETENTQITPDREHRRRKPFGHNGQSAREGCDL